MPELSVVNQGNLAYAAGGSYIAPDFKNSGLDRPGAWGRFR